MASRVPEKGPVRDEAAKAGALLRRWADELGPTRFDRKKLEALLIDLAGEKKSAWDHWDGAAQLYLGLAAVNQGLGDVSLDHRKRTELPAALKEMRGQLEKAFPKDSNSLYHTPSNFDVNAFGKELQQLRDRLK